ncbi:hypothetical protein [Paraburkholderia graminis]|uniref:Ankyrin repeat protein n=1 Tax=Paraburkholderia graminis TaxID=60548 RepID=A0ABD5CSI9_9BURK|nr:hypothetical protein [Paraburkholderia graminis]MDR6208056.1 ankyrin repeat protein [Paraburkholderia graminis]
MTNTILAVSVTSNSSANFTRTQSAQSLSDGNVVGSLIDARIINRTNYKEYATALLVQKDVGNIDRALLTILGDEIGESPSSNRTLDAIAQLYATFKPHVCFPNSSTTMVHDALMRQLQIDTSLPDLRARIAPDYFAHISKANETVGAFTLVLSDATVEVIPPAINADEIEHLLDELSKRLAAHLSPLDDVDESEREPEADDKLSPPNARTWEARAQTLLAPGGKRAQLFSCLLESPDHLQQALADLPELVSMRDERGDTLLHHAARADFDAVNEAAVAQSVDLLLAHEKTDFRKSQGDAMTIVHYAALNAVNEHVFEKFLDGASSADLSHRVNGLNLLQRVVTARDNGLGASIDGSPVPVTLLPRAKLADMLIHRAPGLAFERSSEGRTALDYALHPDRHEWTFEIPLILAKAIRSGMQPADALSEPPRGDVRGILVRGKISRERDLAYEESLEVSPAAAPTVAERLQRLQEEIGLLGRLIGMIKR